MEGEWVVEWTVVGVLAVYRRPGTYAEEKKTIGFEWAPKVSIIGKMACRG